MSKMAGGRGEADVAKVNVAVPHSQQNLLSSASFVPHWEHCLFSVMLAVAWMLVASIGYREIETSCS